MAENVLPKISAETRARISSYGLTNHLYDYLKMPSFFTPRAPGFDAYTYSIMGLSAVGGILARRYGSVTFPFAVAFLFAPLIGFYMKKEADYNYGSQISKRPASNILQQFPILNQSFKQVVQQADEEIARIEDRICVLQERLNRK